MHMDSYKEKGAIVGGKASALLVSSVAIKSQVFSVIGMLVTRNSSTALMSCI